jgi:hypothetical protein
LQQVAGKTAPDRKQQQKKNIQKKNCPLIFSRTQQFQHIAQAKSSNIATTNMGGMDHQRIFIISVGKK